MPVFTRRMIGYANLMSETATLRSWPSSGGHINIHSFAVSRAVHLGCVSCWAEKAALNLELGVWEMGWRNRLPSL